jgi:hypothetical protein
VSPGPVYSRKGQRRLVNRAIDVEAAFLEGEMDRTLHQSASCAGIVPLRHRSGKNDVIRLMMSQYGCVKVHLVEEFVSIVTNEVCQLKRYRRILHLPIVAMTTEKNRPATNGGYIDRQSLLGNALLTTSNVVCRNILSTSWSIATPSWVYGARRGGPYYEMEMKDFVDGYLRRRCCRRPSVSKSGYPSTVLSKNEGPQ